MEEQTIEVDDGILLHKRVVPSSLRPEILDQTYIYSVPLH